MPNFSRISQKLLDSFAGSTFGAIATGGYKLIAFNIGNAILKNCEWEASWEITAFLKGLLWGGVTGAVAAPIFYQRFSILCIEQARPYSFTKKLLPALYIALPLVTEGLGLAFSSIDPVRLCTDILSIDVRNSKECNARVENVPLAQASLTGAAILTGASLLGYTCYKLITKTYRNVALVEEDLPYHLVVDPIDQPHSPIQHIEHNVYHPLALRSRLEACYVGEIPPDFIDSVELVLMNDPIMLRCGDNFDREFLANLEANCIRCPKCRAPFLESDFTHPGPNTFLRGKIIEFVEEKERLVRQAVLAMAPGLAVEIEGVPNESVDIEIKSSPSDLRRRGLFSPTVMVIDVEPPSNNYSMQP